MFTWVLPNVLYCFTWCVMFYIWLTIAKTKLIFQLYRYLTTNSTWRFPPKQDALLVNYIFPPFFLTNQTTDNTFTIVFWLVKLFSVSPLCTLLSTLPVEWQIENYTQWFDWSQIKVGKFRLMEMSLAKCKTTSRIRLYWICSCLRWKCTF